MRIFLLFSSLLLLHSCTNEAPMSTDIDWQGHRGARGLVPENTIPAFLKALEFPAVTTLELDVVISKDRQVVVSHEPWMSHHICSHSNEMPIREADRDFVNLYRLTYEQIRTFDCGMRGNERFPEQAPMKVHKPTLPAVVEAVNAYCDQQNRPRPNYNIELKSRPEWDSLFTPPPAEFVQIVLQCLDSLDLQGHYNLQSFDERMLELLHEQRPDLPLAYLLEDFEGVEASLKNLSFQPTIYSPYYPLVTAKVVEAVHVKGMQIIPWTVNETQEMEALLKLGVDGIITDYPNRIPGTKN